MAHETKIKMGDSNNDEDNTNNINTIRSVGRRVGGWEKEETEREL
jgi:hypothetical protein